MNQQFYIRSFFVFVLLFTGFYSSSQSFKGYAHGGIIAAQVDGDNESGYNKPGIFAGMAVSYPLSQVSDLMLEINYIELGARKNTNPDIGYYDKYIFRANYIQVPLIYRFKVHPRLNLDGGLSFSTLIKTKQFDINGEVPVVGGTLNKFDIGGMVGFNFVINSRWSVLLRTAMSILPFRVNPTVNYFFFNHHDFHRYLNTSIQYKF